MVIWLGVLCGILTAVSILLAAKLVLIWKAAGELGDGMEEKLREDTNTLIDLSCGDRHMRRLAVQLNEQLKLLRKERHRYRQGDRELKEAVTNISHDLRTPLTAVSGYLDLLEREELPEAAARYVAMIGNRTQAMKQLTEELFRYSVAASSPALGRERVCVNDVLAGSLAAYYGALTQKGISPQVSIPERPVERYLDRAALGRVFGNCLGNAVKYSSGGLTVTLDADGGICFANEAPEMDPVLAGKLFDRYFTVEAGKDSTGLGLSIAKLLTEQMGGSIGAQYRDGRLYVTLRFPRDDCM